MAELALARSFLDSLSRLTVQDQRQVRESLSKATLDVSRGGLRLHPVGAFHSLSPNMDLRVIAWRSKTSLVLVHVDHHDAAYAWANRHRAVVGKEGNLLAFLAIAPSEVPPHAEGPRATPDRASRFAVLPRPLAEALAAIEDEAELLEAIEAISPEYQEAVLAGATTELSAGPSDVVAVDDAALRDALRLPTQAWRLFLHPKQRYIVTRPNEGNLVIRGGPGTGKTVALVHRYVHLAAIAERERTPLPCFIALTPASRRVVREMLVALGKQVPDEALLVSSDLRHGESLLARTVGRFGAVLVDEGQDLPTAVVANLLSLLERGQSLPPIVVAFDPNQAIVHPTGDALRRFTGVSDALTLTYCYRATRQLVEAARALLDILHRNYVGKDFKGDHALGASRDGVTARLVTALEGPEVIYRSSTASEVPGVVVEAIRRSIGTYAPDSLAVVVAAGSGQTGVEAVLRDLLPGVEVLSPYDAKGREFLAGVVVDMLGRAEVVGGPTRVTEARYKALSGLYVAVTRFRDRLEYIRVEAAEAGA